MFAGSLDTNPLPLLTDIPIYSGNDRRNRFPILGSAVIPVCAADIL